MTLNVSARARDYILARGQTAHLLDIRGVGMC